MNINCIIFLNIILLSQISLYASEYNNKKAVEYSEEIKIYQRIPFEIWQTILKYGKNNLFITASFFNEIRKQQNEKKIKLRCENILRKNIEYDELRSDEFLADQYDDIFSTVFTEETREKLNEHYNNTFPLFFLKYAHKEYVNAEYIKEHFLLENTILIEDKEFIDVTKHQYIIFSLINTNLKAIECKTAQTKGSFKKLIETYQSKNILRILLNKDIYLPFELEDLELKGQRKEIEENFLKNISPIIIQNMNGESPLHYAIDKSFPHYSLYTTLMIKHGADLEIVDYSGLTPLFKSVGRYLTCWPLFFLEHGANPNVQVMNKYYEETPTPLSFCEKTDDKIKVNLLKKYGAKE